MDEALKQRLAGLISEKKSQDEAADRAARAQQEALERLRGQQEAARAAWPRAEAYIRDAVREISGQVTTAGWALSADTGTAELGRLAQFSISLTDKGGRKTCRLILNVSDEGRAHPVFLVPNSGKGAPQFDISDANQDYYENLIIVFLEQVTANSAKKP